MAGFPYLGARGGLPTSLEPHEHDDVVLPLGGLPHGHPGVNQRTQLVEDSRLDDATFVQARGHLVKVNGRSAGVGGLGSEGRVGGVFVRKIVSSL